MRAIAWLFGRAPLDWLLMAFAVALLCSSCGDDLQRACNQDDRVIHVNLCATPGTAVCHVLPLGTHVTGCWLTIDQTTSETAECVAVCPE